MYTNLKLSAQETSTAVGTTSAKSSVHPDLRNVHGLTVQVTPDRHVKAVIQLLNSDGKKVGESVYAHSTDPVVIRKKSKKLIESYSELLNFDGKLLSVVPSGTYNPHNVSVEVTSCNHVKSMIEIFDSSGRTTRVTRYTHSYKPKKIIEMVRELIEDYNKAIDFGPNRNQIIPAGTYNPRGVTVEVEASAYVALQLHLLVDGKKTEFSKYTHSYDDSVVKAKTVELVEEYNQIKDIEESFNQ